MRIALASVDETRQIETTVMSSRAFPQLLLMERAALAVAEVARRVSPGTRIGVLAGWGHNGADGVAAARLLSTWGYAPRVVTVAGPACPALEQQTAWARTWGVPIQAFEGELPGGKLPEADLWIDGVFGFGLNRAPQGEAERAIEALNAQAAPVVAIDLPSGLDGSRGVALGKAVNADHTVSLGLLKAGLLCDPALERIGELWLGELGFPRELTDALPGELLLADPWPERPLASHKGDAGFVLVVGGSRSMSGAPVMASLAAGRIGAGLVYAAVPAGIRDVVALGMPEAVVVPLPEDSEGGIAVEAWETLVPLLERCHAGILGPGLGRGAGAQEVAGKLMRVWDRPMVVDADALLAVSGPFGGARVLTPHPGEMSRLMGVPSAEIQADRIRWAREGAERLGAVLVLKGARTVVAEPGGRYGVSAGGHPVLATAGSGDVLAGLIGGLLTQRQGAREAAGRGVYVHAGLGARAARGPRGRSMLALDMLNCLTDVLRSMSPWTAFPGSAPIHVASLAKGE